MMASQSDNNMNTPHDQVPSSEQLSQEMAQLERIRQQIFSDMEALRTQEQNLRTYEARLRDSGPLHPAAAPMSADGQHQLDVEREKISRLRALLEAERRALIDERLIVREEKSMLAEKAEQLKQREAWIDARERDFAAKAFAPPPQKLASTPLVAARSFFSLRRRAVG